MGFLLHGLPPGGVINGLEILPSDLLFCGVWLHNPEHCAIPFRGLVHLSPFKERGKERIRKASPYFPTASLVTGIFCSFLGFFTFLLPLVPIACSPHCISESIILALRTLLLWTKRQVA